MNGYVCFWKTHRIEVLAKTAYQAQSLAATRLKNQGMKRVLARDIHVVLAEKDGVPVVHSGSELP